MALTEKELNLIRQYIDGHRGSIVLPSSETDDFDIVYLNGIGRDSLEMIGFDDEIAEINVPLRFSGWGKL